MIWELEFNAKARKALVSVPKKDKERIAQALIAMESNPFGGDFRHVTGRTNEYARRVGNWRIVFSLQEDRGVIYIWKVDRKGKSTYK